MSAKWRNIIREKLAPMYNGKHLNLPWKQGAVTIPAANKGNFSDFFKWELTLLFEYKDERIVVDDMYGDSHFLGGDEYIICYYVIESDGVYDDRYVDVGISLDEVLGFLVHNFSIDRLLNMETSFCDLLSARG